MPNTPQFAPLDPFDSLDPHHDAHRARPEACAMCEAMLPDAVDGFLTAAEQQAFDKHVAGCVACAQELEDAQRGAAWLGMLKGDAPEPPAALLQRILAETSGAAENSFATPVAEVPQASKPGWLMSVRTRLVETFRIDLGRATFQPRLAMTAAMAFFSVALTMNLTGMTAGSLHAQNLKPTSLRRTVVDLGASAQRSIQNLRVVHQFESRVSDARNEGMDRPRARRDGQ